MAGDPPRLTAGTTTSWPGKWYFRISGAAALFLYLALIVQKSFSVTG